MAQCFISRRGSKDNNPFKGWVYKTGSKSASEVNGNPNIIPLMGRVTGVAQGGGTPENWIKYGDTKIFSIFMYSSGGNAYLSFGPDALAYRKLQITASECPLPTVTAWLEKA